MNITNILKIPNYYFSSTEAEIVDAVKKLKSNSNLPLETVQGQYSIVNADDENIYLIRDRLGINKLFYCIKQETKSLYVGNYCFEVMKAAEEYDRILSVPPGHYVKINKKTMSPTVGCFYDISATETLTPEKFDLKKFQDENDKILTNFFKKMNQNFPNSLFIVCLSGGLDSSAVATYAKRYLNRVKAVTFSFGDGDHQGVSEDFVAGKAIADALKLEFVPIVAPQKYDLPTLDVILKNCQDWRDFNVHCAWLNRIIGQKVRETFPNENLVLLTGDMMNEFVADYTPVDYKGVQYYPQPKVSRDRLRRFFIYGLDTSDREIGIFHEFGLMTIQPYGALAEQYLKVPENVIDNKGCKETLNLPLIPVAEVADLIVKKKVRAQVGGKDGGVLAMFHDQGASQEFLRERWNKLIAPWSKDSKPAPLIISGRYRSQ